MIAAIGFVLVIISTIVINKKGSGFSSSLMHNTYDKIFIPVGVVGFALMGISFAIWLWRTMP
jgi:hypothetical protein